ncbi:MAG: hypothetical protein P8N50_08540 [Actinomycetota bacterium]|nr:hypothetical protein [Actinomycetota bacterium]
MPGSSPSTPSKFRKVWLPRLIITVGSIAAVAAFAVALRTANTGDRNPQFDLAVESVFPTQDALEPRQTTVSIDLASGWVLDQLVIEGVRLETEFINDSGRALGQFYFEPGEGTPFPLFKPGTIEVTAFIVNELEPTGQRKKIEWSFTAS